MLTTKRITVPNIMRVFKTVTDPIIYAKIWKGKTSVTLRTTKNSLPVSKSFETAMCRLGGDVIHCDNLPDSELQYMSKQGDISLINHHNYQYMSYLSSQTKTPIINIGNANPSQALIYLFSIYAFLNIQQRHHSIAYNRVVPELNINAVKPLRILFVGAGILHSSPVYSLIQLLVKYPSVTIKIQSPVKEQIWNTTHYQKLLYWSPISHALYGNQYKLYNTSIVFPRNIDYNNYDVIYFEKKGDLSRISPSYLNDNTHIIYETDTSEYDIPIRMSILHHLLLDAYRK